MRILFGPPTRSYLDAQRAFAQGFSDLKSHQLRTYMAMQHAVHELIAGIDPTLMARELELQRGASSARHEQGQTLGRVLDALESASWPRQQRPDRNLYVAFLELLRPR